MPFITLKEYAATYFSEDSRPSYHTVWRWAQAGLLPVKHFGRSLYINTDKLDAGGLPTVSASPLVNRVLKR